MTFYCMGGIPFEVQAHYASAPCIKQEVKVYISAIVHYTAAV